ILRIPYVVGSNGLASMRSVGDDADGAGWSVTRLHKQGADVGATTYGEDGGYDFDGIELHAGDVLHLAFVGGAGAPAGGRAAGRHGACAGRGRAQGTARRHGRRARRARRRVQGTAAVNGRVILPVLIILATLLPILATLLPESDARADQSNTYELREQIT